jgi:hypothetical protein
MMSSKIKPFFVGCVGLVILTFLGIIFVFVGWTRESVERQSRELSEKIEADSKKRTAETLGTITKYEEVLRSGRTDHYKYVYYDYTVNGKTYAGKSFAPDGSSDTHRKGVEGKVCYEPARPGNVQFYLKEENQSCGQ